DSGSRDGTLALLARYPVRVEHLERFTYGAALNGGAAIAEGALVVYLSAHCRPLARDWLARLLAPFADPQVVASFGRQVPVPGVNPIEALTTARNFPAAPPPGVLFSTANGAVRRAAVLARPFDEEIAIAEDHLWARGAAERIAYAPEAVVAHSHPMGLGPWRARFYAHGLAAEYARRRRSGERSYISSTASSVPIASSATVSPRPATCSLQAPSGARRLVSIRRSRCETRTYA